MPQLITDPAQIAATQRHLESVLRAASSWTGRRRIANANNMELGGCELSWHGRGRFWSAATGNLRGRWCNAFGVDDPRELPAVRNTVWINPRESGVEGRAFAAFARDADGHRLLLHTGRLGGGHEGVTRAAFLRSGEHRQVQADSREFVVVADLDSPAAVDQIAAYVHKVAAFKAEVGAADDDDDASDDLADSTAPSFDASAWLRDAVLSTYADDATRHALLAWMRDAIRDADARTPSAWALTRRTSPPRVRLIVGDAVAFELGVGRVGVGVHLPSIPPPQVASLAADTDEADFQFARIDGGVFRYLSVDRFLASRDRLQAPARAFVEQIASRHQQTAFARYHVPALLDVLAREFDEDLPQPRHAGARVTSPAAATPLDADETAAIIARAREHLPPERLQTRAAAIDQARALVEAHLGALTEAHARALLRFFNTDHLNHRTAYNRFSPAFTGHLANTLIADLEPLNHWIAEIWRAHTDAEVERVLDAFWSSDAVTGAGRSFPTMLLHVREPGRFAPLMSGLAKGYERLTGLRARGRRGEVYLGYARNVAALCEQFEIPAHGVDAVLSAAGREPGLETTPPTPSAKTTIPPTEQVVYDRDTLLAQTLLPEQQLDEIEFLLRDKPQIVLCGPPGTGKTFLAERLARYLVRDGGAWKVVQFHPSYGYEDFIEGIRPQTTAAGGVAYGVEPGIFRRMCEQAAAKPHETFVLVIDEINRGNLPRIFGELLYLLERRGSAHQVELAASRQAFSVPRNLIVIGTMNTADQSIALIDVALRRRFHFVTLEPQPDLLRTWLQERGSPMVRVADVLARLNTALQREGIDENLLIGHSHFMVEGLDDDGLRRIWNFSIRPTLADYFYGKPAKLRRFDYEKFVELGDDEDVGDA